MNAPEFLAKWRRLELSERSAAQQHLLDLCGLLGHEKPAADPERNSLTFERGTTRLRVRTLTNRYKPDPTWLAFTHKKSDVAVLATFSLYPSITEDPLLDSLTSVNLFRPGCSSERRNQL